MNLKHMIHDVIKNAYYEGYHDKRESRLDTTNDAWLMSDSCGFADGRSGDLVYLDKELEGSAEDE